MKAKVQIVVLINNRKAENIWNVAGKLTNLGIGDNNQITPCAMKNKAFAKNVAEVKSFISRVAPFFPFKMMKVDAREYSAMENEEMAFGIALFPKMYPSIVEIK